MRPHHAAAFDALPLATRQRLFLMEGIRSPRPDAEAWSRAGHCQADAVLLLLLEERIPEAESLVGRPMTTCPPAMPVWPPHPCRVRRRGDDRRIIALTPINPWRTALARARHDVVRVGLSVREVLARGFSRRYLRRYLRKGWIRLEGQS